MERKSKKGLSKNVCKIVKMFGARMKDWIRRKSYSKNIITPNERNISEKNAKFLEQSTKPR